MTMPGGPGKMCFDDIRLYRPRSEPGPQRQAGLLPAIEIAPLITDLRQFGAYIERFGIGPLAPKQAVVVVRIHDPSGRKVAMVENESVSSNFV